MYFDAFGIVVSSLEESVKFYSLLGLAFDEIDGPHVEAVTKSGVRIMLDSEELIKSIDPEWHRPSGQAMGLAFHCETSAGVDEAYARITAAGFQGAKEPWDAFWGQRYAQVTDPDGNKVDLFAPL